MSRPPYVSPRTAEQFRANAAYHHKLANRYFVAFIIFGVAAVINIAALIIRLAL